MTFTVLVPALVVSQIIIISTIVDAINPELLFVSGDKISFIVNGSSPTIEGPVKIYRAVRAGDNITIPCHVNGDPIPTQTWYQVYLTITS